MKLVRELMPIVVIRWILLAFFRVTSWILTQSYARQRTGTARVEIKCIYVLRSTENHYKQYSVWTLFVGFTVAYTAR